jgi:hypothetical protein
MKDFLSFLSTLARLQQSDGRKETRAEYSQNVCTDQLFFFALALSSFHCHIIVCISCHCCCQSEKNSRESIFVVCKSEDSLIAQHLRELLKSHFEREGAKVSMATAKKLLVVLFCVCVGMRVRVSSLSLFESGENKRKRTKCNCLIEFYCHKWSLRSSARNHSSPAYR